MSTPTTPFQQDAYPDFAPEANAPAEATIDPDNPPWGVGTAAFVWLASIALLVIVQLLAVVPYAFYRYEGNVAQVLEGLTKDATVLLVAIVSTIPAHLLTLLLVWAVVTGFGRRPFFETIGWSWSERVGFWTSALLAIGLLLVALGLTYLTGGEKTPFDQMLQSSPSAKLITVFLATATAPLVEEMVYRGVLYPALQRALGMIAAVFIVGSLFTIIHVAQYYNNLGVIAAVGMLGFVLTYVRARTGRLLPCFVIHLVFNGIQCAGLVVEHFLPQTGSGDGATTETTLDTLAETARAFALFIL